MNARSELLYIQTSSPVLLTEVFRGFPMAARTSSLVMPTERRCSLGRLSFSGFASLAGSVLVVSVWPLLSEAQPEKRATVPAANILRKNSFFICLNQICFLAFVRFARNPFAARHFAEQQSKVNKSII